MGFELELHGGSLLWIKPEAEELGPSLLGETVLNVQDPLEQSVSHSTFYSSVDPRGPLCERVEVWIEPYVTRCLDRAAKGKV